MNYNRIIIENLDIFHGIWPRYAFHLAGLDNALNILAQGYIYSRNKAKQYGVMLSDNASEEVIDHTDDAVKNFARFYFRPKNPTYYHMEGYHQEGLRYSKEGCVNITVPVMFMFDLETLLMDPCTKFNEIKASGKNNFHPLCGVEAFHSLQFDKIYNQYTKDRDIILNYRCAEVMYPEMYPIAKSLKYIVCRNKWEEKTLRTELRRKSKSAYDQWERFIQNEEDLFCGKETLFDRTGLRIEYINQNRSVIEDDVLQLEFALRGQSAYYEYIRRNFSDNPSRTEYPPLKVIFDVQFTGSLYHHELTGNVILTKPDIAKGVDMIPRNAKKLRLQIYFDNKNTSNLAFAGNVPLSDQFKRYRLILNAENVMPLFPSKHNESIQLPVSDYDDELPF